MTPEEKKEWRLFNKRQRQKRRNKSLRRRRAAKIKKLLKLFWLHCGNHAVSPRRSEERLAILRDYSEIVIGPELGLRAAYNCLKWVRFPLEERLCFVCGSAASARHHILTLRNGGDNRPENVIPICDHCHWLIHPWMEGEASA